MFRAVRAVAFFNFDDRSERDKLSTLVSYFQGQDIGWSLPESFIGLRNHLVGPSESIKIIHVQRTEINLQGIGCICLGQTQSSRLFHIDIRLQLRNVYRKAGKKAANFRRFRSSLEQPLSCVIERFITEPGAIFQLQLKPANVSQALNRWRRKDDDKSALN